MTYVHTIITELNKTFITPIERDDIMELTTTLDDVYGWTRSNGFPFLYVPTDRSGRIYRYSLLKFCANRLTKFEGDSSAVQKKLWRFVSIPFDLNDLENQGDEVLRMCIKHLFATVSDPIELIKRKEIYERLETTTDACEDVANVSNPSLCVILKEPEYGNNVFRY